MQLTVASGQLLSGQQWFGEHDSSGDNTASNSKALKALWIEDKIMIMISTQGDRYDQVT
jgi:hypothetical protein